MKYKIFFTDSLEVLNNEELIGEANTFVEACKILKQDPIAATNRYWRYLLGDIATFIDYGSYSRFAAIVPPVPTKELMGKTKEES